MKVRKLNTLRNNKTSCAYIISSKKHEKAHDWLKPVQLFFIVHNAYTNHSLINSIYLFHDKVANRAKVGQITLPDLSIKRLGGIVRWCFYTLNRHVSNNIRRRLPVFFPRRQYGRHHLKKRYKKHYILKRMTINKCLLCSFGDVCVTIEKIGKQRSIILTHSGTEKSQWRMVPSTEAVQQ